ncbi:AbrB/MazE/SpoVT family DNA-binding domain-containing protein [Candidatus Micrarchaeota archaeon]|nr:AbrB/MazE/SpoVT family DNA-binding domain-containing protein [Candidatus Micrarchaeota archaeon]
MKSEKCFKCGGKLEKISGMHKGIEYSALKCVSCGEEIMDLTQAKDFMKKAEEARQVTFSKWGQAVAVRIPADVVKAFKIKVRETGKLIREKDGFKIIPT